MQGYLPRRLLIAVMALCLATMASAGEVLSTMRNVNAVVEAHGFRLNMVHDVQIPPMQTDLSPAQAFEVLRPAGKAVTIGRLFTSCSCIQLESPKRNFGPDERVILTLRNIKPTPPAGQVYAVFVQITSPVRTTLRFDTYVQSGMAGGMPFDNPAGQNLADGADKEKPAQAATAAGGAPFSGSSHADAVAALTRQIDQGMAQATAPRMEPLPELALAPAPMVPPAAPTTATTAARTENVAEARETPAAPLPTTAVQTPAVKVAQTEAAEAAEIPAPLPPPAELTRPAAVVTRELEPPAGVALVPGSLAQTPTRTTTTTTTRTEAAALPPLQLPTATDARTALPDLNLGGGATVEASENEEDYDDYNPLLGGGIPDPRTAIDAPALPPVAPLAPATATAVAAPAAVTTAVTTRTTTTTTRPAASAQQGAFTSSTLSVEELERELKNDLDELYGRENSGIISDQEILEKERDRLESNDDLGTADLFGDDMRAVPGGIASQPARTTAAVAGTVALPAVTAAPTTATRATATPATAIVAREVSDNTATAYAAGNTAPQTAYAAGNAAPQQTGGFLVDEIVPTAGGQAATGYSTEQLRAAGDNLPPPPGLSAPAGADARLLTAREVPVQAAGYADVDDDAGTASLYDQQLAPVAPIAVQATPAPGQAYVPAQMYDEGTPEPRPERNPNIAKPVQAVSLITVGVRDLQASIRFYEALGWRRAARGKYDQTAFFQLQGQILALYPMNELLAEQNMPAASPTPGGITLALHVQDRADVWSIYQRFVDAGGKSLRPPAEMASGAVTSYVADPDGNAWEISWVPQFRIDEEGGLWLP